MADLSLVAQTVSAAASVSEAAQAAINLGIGGGLAAGLAAVVLVWVSVNWLPLPSKTARQPEAAGDLKGTMILAALIEGVALFGVVVGLLAALG